MLVVSLSWLFLVFPVADFGLETCCHRKPNNFENP